MGLVEEVCRRNCHGGALTTKGTDVELAGHLPQTYDER